MSKTLLFMRTHLITKGVISEFLKLKNSGVYDCVLFIDNHKQIINTSTEPLLSSEINCFVFDSDVFDSLNLPLYANKNNNKKLSEVMWYCADYAFYAIRKYYTKYEYYWQFDYDVFLNGKSYEPFLNNYKENNKDLIIPYFRELTAFDANWPIKDKSDWIYKNVKKFGSFFPVSRLSANAIDYLYKKRLEHKAIFCNKIYKSKKNRWINCELFVPTELGNSKEFECECIDNQPLRFFPNYDLNEDRLFENPDNLIYHPVKGNYEEKLELLNKKLKDAKFSLFGYNLSFYKN